MVRVRVRVWGWIRVRVSVGGWEVRQLRKLLDIRQRTCTQIMFIELDEATAAMDVILGVLTEASSEGGEDKEEGEEGEAGKDGEAVEEVEEVEAVEVEEMDDNDSDEIY